VEPGSVASGDEKKKEPDIVCRLSGQSYTFELGRIAEQEGTTRRADAIRTREIKGGAVSMVKLLTETLKKKTTKSYATGGRPLDLLLYFDNEYAETSQHPPEAFEEWAREHMLSVISRNPGPFARFWVFDRNDQCVLWLYPN
jgi:hypothetical protein